MKKGDTLEERVYTICHTNSYCLGTVFHQGKKKSTHSKPFLALFAFSFTSILYLLFQLKIVGNLQYPKKKKKSGISQVMGNSGIQRTCLRKDKGETRIQLRNILGLLVQELLEEQDYRTNVFFLRKVSHFEREKPLWGFILVLNFFFFWPCYVA